jgi:hypothetical protein
MHPKRPFLILLHNLLTVHFVLPVPLFTSQNIKSVLILVKLLTWNDRNSPFLQQIPRNSKLTGCIHRYNITVVVDDLGFNMRMDLSDSLDAFDKWVCGCSLEGYGAVKSKSQP